MTARARDELLEPLGELSARVRTGSPVLARMILRGLVRAFKQAMGGGGAAEGAAPAPAREEPAGPAWTGAADFAKKPQGEGGTAGDGPAAPKVAKERGTSAAVTGFGERLALGGIIIAVALSALGTIGAALAHLLAPYRLWIIPVLITGWCLAAAAVAPEPEKQEDDTEDDQENEAGEEGEESPDEAGQWAERKAAIVKFVEQEVAAGAARHLEAKGRGATVDHLLARMQEKRPLSGWDRRRILDVLDQTGIPYREQMAFTIDGERKNLPGVHVEDLAELLGNSPRLPPHLVPDLTPDSPRIQASAPPPEWRPAGPAPEAPGEGRTGAA